MTSPTDNVQPHPTKRKLLPVGAHIGAAAQNIAQSSQKMLQIADQYRATGMPELIEFANALTVCAAVCAEGVKVLGTSIDNISKKYKPAEEQFIRQTEPPATMPYMPPLKT